MRLREGPNQGGQRLSPLPARPRDKGHRSTGLASLLHRRAVYSTSGASTSTGTAARSTVWIGHVCPKVKMDGSGVKLR